MNGQSKNIRQLRRVSESKTVGDSQPIPFDDALRRLVNTPPKPRKAKPGKAVKAKKPKVRA